MPHKSKDSPYFQAFQKRRLCLQTVPFQDDTIMDENPPRSWKVADFREPRLRRCNLDLDSVDWEHANVVGAGMDGFVWRVYFGDKGPYALKLFWDPDPHDVKQAGSFAAQRECQNAALLQMIRASVDQATAEGSKTPVLVLADPSTLEDAKANFFGFAEEVRRTRMRKQVLMAMRGQRRTW